MRSSTHSENTSTLPLGLALGLAVLVALGNASAWAAAQTAKVLPPESSPYGKSYGEWSAAWWKWAMELPLDGHPFLDTPGFDASVGQSGRVWFLGGPFGTVERTATIPAGTALFVGIATAEASDLEGLGSTPAERGATADWLADHIVSLGCSIDGTPVGNVTSYRILSPEFTFTAPSPWLFGDVGGLGTSVGDGYFVMLAPLAVGSHTIEMDAHIRFSEADGDPFDADLLIDMTYRLNVE